MDAMAPNARYNVRRQSPQVVRASEATPNHILSLSNLDDQTTFRYHLPVLQFYGRNASRDGQDPRQAIRDGLGKVLIPYYPFAGRLRHAEDGKLCVDCTGEGVVFIAAEADARLVEFGELRPPFPGWQELIHAPPGCDGITDAPLLVIQVTLLRCGGFVVGTRFNHVLCDITGLLQFMNTLAQICRGGEPGSPRVDPPVWRRRTLLPPRNPPQVNSSAVLQAQHHGRPGASDWASEEGMNMNMSEECVVFRRRDVAALKRQFAGANTFELLSACLWRSRTRALYASASSAGEHETVKVAFPVNVRRLLRPPVDRGYYGNVIVWACASASAGEVCRAPLQKVVNWIRDAKNGVDEEYVRSYVDAAELQQGRDPVCLHGTFLLSDVYRVAVAEVDFGWGNAAYGGPAATSAGPVRGPGTPLNAGADGAVVAALCLPRHCMPVFLREVYHIVEATPGRLVPNM